MRALYDPFLHGYRRHIGSEEWVSLALGPLDHYLHHHSRPIVAYFDLSLLGWVVHRYHTLSHFLSLLFSLFSSVLLHHSFYPFSFSSTLVDHHFASWTACPLEFINLSFGIVHLYVGWVTRLARSSDIWHCALRGLVLSFGYLGFVSHCFIHLWPLAFITIKVVRPPWGYKISCFLLHISFGQASSTGWSTGNRPTFVSWGYRGIA